MTRHRIKTPHPKSREEAWSDWEASMLNRAFNQLPESDPGQYRRRWNKTFRSNHTRWFLFALDKRPNRGEILVTPVRTKTPEWLNIMRPHVIEYGMKWETLYINDTYFPVMAHRQQMLLTGRVETTWPWYYILGMSLEQIEEKKAINAARKEEREQEQQQAVEDEKEDEIIQRREDWLNEQSRLWKVVYKDGEKLLIPKAWSQENLLKMRNLDLLSWYRYDYVVNLVGVGNVSQVKRLLNPPPLNH